VTAPVPDRLFLEFQEAVAGRYSLERELGRGGMGVVYLAREVRLDRPVAIKLLPPLLADRVELRERFQREARMAARLSHPNIVPIFAVDEVERFVFYAMAYIDGETVAHRVATRGPLAPAEATRILREVAWGLAYAHAQGVIHRDVKPENILLEGASGRALVADFGIARVTREGGVTGPGEVIGTPEFMSPEQAVGDTADGRADLYSLGAVGYFMLAGRPPYTGTSAAAVLSQHIAAPLPALEGPGIPRRLARALERCLVKDPSGRPQKGEDFAESLGQVLEAHKELPVALRVFVKRGGRLGGIGGLLYLLGAWTGIAVVVGSAPRGHMLLGFWLAFGTAFGLGPLLMLAVRARRFLASGFDPKDLPAAFRAELEQGLEERVFEFGRRASLYEKVTGLLACAGAAGAVAAGFWLRAVGGAAAGATLGWSIITFLSSGFLYLTRVNRRVDLDTKIWSWVWRGPIGRALFAAARPFVKRRAVPAAGTHRATELALSLAAEQLYDALPKATRAKLKELPDALRRLEGDAQRLRARLDELQDALAGGEASTAPADDPIGRRRAEVRQALEAERGLVERRHADAVAALESIRLSLLRLHAGTGSVETLTTDLGLSREISADAQRLLEAHRELEAGL